MGSSSARVRSASARAFARRNLIGLGRERGWDQAGSLACFLVPGALLVYLSFRAGGLFVDTTALVAVVLATLIVLRIVLAQDPLAGMSMSLAVASGALCLYAAWTLASVYWSDAPGRALIEFNRTLVYLFGLILFGSFARIASRVRWLVRGLALGITTVCVAGFVSRTVPELWSATPSPLSPDRLSFPLTYWNAMGMVAAIGVIACFYLATSSREPPVLRVVGSAALPLIAATLLLTFSRGAIAACAVGVVAYAILGRPRAMLGGLIAGVPSVGVAVIASYQATEVATGDSTAQAIDQGHDLALLTLACVGFAAAVRALMLFLDRTPHLLPKGRMAMVVRAGPAALVAAAVGVGLAAGGAGFLDRQYDRFVEGHVEEGQVRDRLSQPGSSGRIAHWDVALEGFRQNRLHGQGAGTYPTLWYRYRPASFNAMEAHSLYLEALGELGLVGLLLLVACLGMLLAGSGARALGHDRAVYGALFGAILAWALYAGIDWLWEMPAVTLWVFCGAGAALASDEGVLRTPVGRRVRLLIALAVLLLAMTPALVGLSQRHLNDGIRAFERGNCPGAVDAALDSISTVSVRPEPYEILGYCDARAGLGTRATNAFEAAIRRDPQNWELHYGLAVARAASGMDPRRAARAALRLNPRSRSAEVAVRAFSTRSANSWRRLAAAMPLPVP